MTNYRCEGLSIDPEDAFYWLWSWLYDRQHYAEEREAHKATAATLERVRARYRALKGRAEPKE